MWSYYNWIRSSVAANKPWDQMARELLTASGNTLANGAANYYVLHKNPIDVTENVAMTFMGFSITCARCHNHPLEKWTQKDYYQMANLFSRVAVKNGTDRGDLIVYPARTGEINHPAAQRAAAAAAAGRAAAAARLAGTDRREFFADWLVSPDNPFFARALVNRVWKNFMGRGLVEGGRRHPRRQPAVQPGAARGAHARFRRASLRRQASGPDDHEFDDLPADVEADRDQRRRSEVPLALHRAAAPGRSDSRRDQPGDGRCARHFPGHPGRRALQLPDAAVDSYFLTAFGRPPRVTAADSERQQEPSITQALHVINGDTINQKLAAPRGLIQTLVDGSSDNRTAVERIYLAALSRHPSDEELRTLVAGDGRGASHADGRRGAAAPRARGSGVGGPDGPGIPVQPLIPSDAHDGPLSCRPALAAAASGRAAAAACAARAPRVPRGSASAGVSFSQVDEIFRESCEHCHNADDEKGGLLMDSYASLVAGGEHGNALVPGDSASSRLMQMIEGKLKPRMPYKEDPLPRAQVELIRRWIDEGAPGPEAADEPAAARREVEIPDVKPLVPGAGRRRRDRVRSADAPDRGRQLQIGAPDGARRPQVDRDAERTTRI